MTVEVSVKGMDGLKAYLDNMTAKMEVNVHKAVLSTAVEMRSDVVKRIQGGPATGIIYPKSSPRRKHQASAPGEAPMTDTGRLSGSVYFEDLGGLTALVGSNVIYAAYLEYGTRHMKPRPAFRPAAEDAETRLKDLVAKAIEAALK